MSINRDNFSLSFSSSRDNQVRWHAETSHGHPHPFVIQRQSSPMTYRDQHGRLHPLSKTQCLSTKTTLVSLCHLETIKSDDMQRPTWSSTLFIKDSTSIDRDYFSLHFRNPKTIKFDSTQRRIWSSAPFGQRLNVFRSRLL